MMKTKETRHMRCRLLPALADEIARADPDTYRREGAKGILRRLVLGPWLDGEDGERVEAVRALIEAGERKRSAMTRRERQELDRLSGGFHMPLREHGIIEQARALAAPGMIAELGLLSRLDSEVPLKHPLELVAMGAAGRIRQLATP